MGFTELKGGEHIHSGRVMYPNFTGTSAPALRTLPDLALRIHSSGYASAFFIISFNKLVVVIVARLSYVQLFATPWTVARRVPLSMRFPRQEYQSGCHFLLQGIFLAQGLNPSLLYCQVDSLLLSQG